MEFFERIIYVKPEDIENGQPGSSDSCPIALALKRTFADPYLDVEVGSDTIMVSGKGLSGSGNVRETYRDDEPPPVVADFVEKFDDEDPVEPFSFTVRFTLDEDAW